MELVLYAVNGPFIGEEIRIPAPGLVFARDRLSLNRIMHDPLLDRPHAHILLHNGVWYLKDLDSSTGTRLNGHPVGTQGEFLQDGALIQIGASTLRVGTPRLAPNVESQGIRSGPPPVVTTRRPTGEARRQALQTYQHGINVIGRDMVISDSEVQELARVQQRLGLTAEDTEHIRATAFEAMVRLAISQNRGNLADFALDLQRKLDLESTAHPAVVHTFSVAINHLGMVELRAGRMPVVNRPSFLLRSGETCNFEIQADWLREDGAYISSGKFAATDMRLMFVGEPKSFQVVWRDVVSLDPITDSLSIYTAKRVTPRVILYRDAAISELVGSICEYYVTR